MKRDILAAVADGAMTTHPSRPAGRGSKRRRDTLEFGVKLLFLLCGCVAVGCVLFICIYLIVAGLPAVLEIGITDFLFGTEWAGKQGQFGILPFILTSVAGTAGAVLVGVPVGILTAMFLAKVAPPKAARVIRTAVELLAGIPSIVYGLVGMIVLVPAIQRTFQLASGATLLAAIVVLAVMILPSIINVAETALQAVPREYEEASLALGATHIETIFRISPCGPLRRGHGGGAGSGTGHRRGHGHYYGVRQRTQYAREPVRPGAFPNHRHCLRDVLCRGGLPLAAGPVLRGPGAVPVHHDHQRDPQRVH